MNAESTLKKDTADLRLWKQEARFAELKTILLWFRDWHSFAVWLRKTPQPTFKGVARSYRQP